MSVCHNCGWGSGVAQDCDLVIITFDDIGYSFCIVCGNDRYDDAEFTTYSELLTDAVCDTKAEETILIRKIISPFSWMYGTLDGCSESRVMVDQTISVTAGSTDGSMTDPIAALTITVDYDDRCGWGEWRLLQLTDSGIWAEVDYLYNDSELTFTTTEAGLFFIVYC